MPSPATDQDTIRRLAAVNCVLPDDVTPPGSKRVILTAALQMFAERSFAGASIRDIATLAEMKPASLYAHYKSKEQMLAQLIRIGHEEHLQYVQQALLDSEPDPRHQLSAFTRAHVRFHAEFTMLAVVVNSELHALTREYVAPALALRERAVQLLTDIIQRGEERGEFNVGHDPWLAAAAIGAMGMRVAHWHSPERNKSIEEIETAYADFACRTVGARETAR